MSVLLISINWPTTIITRDKYQRSTKIIWKSPMNNFAEHVEACISLSHQSDMTENSSFSKHETCLQQFWRTANKLNSQWCWNNNRKYISILLNRYCNLLLIFCDLNQKVIIIIQFVQSKIHHAIVFYK